MSLPSGRAWCARYPTSTSINDLTPRFAESVSSFIYSLKDAGARVDVSATYRPVERAYLMHWAWKIAKREVLPVAIPTMDGVDIDWAYDGNLNAARAGAQEMVDGYGLAYEPVLVSRHTQRRAIDMTIHWKGIIHVKDARGVVHACSKQEELWPIGASFGVIKLPKDAPHWSDDGH
jgi:hypothetical protein